MGFFFPLHLERLRLTLLPGLIGFITAITPCISRAYAANNPPPRGYAGGCPL